MNDYRIFYVWIAGTMLLFLSSLLFVMIPVQAPDPPHPFADVPGAVETSLPDRARVSMAAQAMCTPDVLLDVMDKLVSNAKAITVFVGRLPQTDEDQRLMQADIEKYNAFLAEMDSLLILCGPWRGDTTNAP